MKCIEITLADSLAVFAEEQAAHGGFSDISEYLIALLRTELQAQDKKVFEAKIKEGLESLQRGEGREMTDADWEALHGSRNLDDIEF